MQEPKDLTFLSVSPSAGGCCWPMALTRKERRATYTLSPTPTLAGGPSRKSTKRRAVPKPRDAYDLDLASSLFSSSQQIRDCEDEDGPNARGSGGPTLRQRQVTPALTHSLQVLLSPTLSPLIMGPWLAFLALFRNTTKCRCFVFHVCMWCAHVFACERQLTLVRCGWCGVCLRRCRANSERVQVQKGQAPILYSHATAPRARSSVQQQQQQ